MARCNCDPYCYDCSAGKCDCTCEGGPKGTRPIPQATPRKKSIEEFKAEQVKLSTERHQQNLQRAADSLLALTGFYRTELRTYAIQQQMSVPEKFLEHAALMLAKRSPDLYKAPRPDDLCEHCGCYMPRTIWGIQYHHGDCPNIPY